MVPDATLPADTVIGGRYRVVAPIGRGGMGVVYLVEHVRTGDRLALKVLAAHIAGDPGAIARFEREARASARIKSEHVARVTDAATDAALGGAPYIAMELLDGRELDAVMRRFSLSHEQVVTILVQVARALDRAHGLGIVHRDVKPENVFLHRTERGDVIVKVLDFGISKLVGDAAGDIATAHLTTTGAIMGTPLYMAPEQARAQTALIGPQTDLWAIGLIALRMLTGQIYWNATSVGDLMAQIIAMPIEAPSKRWPALPPAFDAWFLRSCDRDPKLRWPSAGEQIAALAAALGQPRDAAVDLAPLLAGDTGVVVGPAAHTPEAASIAHARTSIDPSSGGGAPKTATLDLADSTLSLTEGAVAAPRDVAITRSASRSAVAGGVALLLAAVGFVAWRAWPTEAPATPVAGVAAPLASAGSSALLASAALPPVATASSAPPPPSGAPLASQRPSKPWRPPTVGPSAPTNVAPPTAPTKPYAPVAP